MVESKQDPQDKHGREQTVEQAKSETEGLGNRRQSRKIVLWPRRLRHPGDPADKRGRRVPPMCDGREGRSSSVLLTKGSGR